MNVYYKTDFENYFNTEFLHSNEKKFTIVLGAGFLNQIINNQPALDEFKYLTSWDSLLHSINPEISFSKNTILNFEAIVLKCTSSSSLGQVLNKTK